MSITASEPVGELVRRWRLQRRRSQLDVSSAAAISTRHLSFIETGRTTPSRAMIERICEELEVPLRERNALHLAAGYAPAHPERAFEDLGPALDAVRSVLTGLEPNPSVAVNVRWEVLAANQAMRLFLDQVPARLRTEPMNVLRATLHPDGLARQIVDLARWRREVLTRVRRQLVRTAAHGLADLLAELETYPVPQPPAPASTAATTAVTDLAIPLQLATPYGNLSMIYTSTVFGSAHDVTLSEIAIETFFPSDPHTAAAFRSLADSTTRTASRHG